MKLIIVDDEMLVRKGIRSAIDWEEIGVSIVGEAENGNHALELIEETQPDLVLTDIKMPKMDGLQLIEIIKTKYPKIKIIALSCYNDLQTVKDAMSYHGAVDFLPKLSLDPENLKNTMLKVKNMIEKSDQPTEKTGFTFFEESWDEFKALEEYLKLSKFPLPISDCRIFVFSLLQTQPTVQNWMVAESIENHMEHYLFKVKILKYIETETYIGIAKLNGASEDMFNKALKSCCSAMSLYFNLKLGFGSAQYSQGADIKALINQCQRIAMPNMSPEIAKLLKYIDENYDKSLNLKTLAKVVSMSDSYLSHIFKRCTGFALIDYINRTRVDKGKELLQKNKYTIYEIAELLGYSSESYFSKVFKQLEGISPNEYKKNINVKYYNY